MTDPTATTGNHCGTRLRWWLAGVLVLLVAAGTAYGITELRDRPNSTDEHAMADRAAEVMPFDLDATTHTFTKTATGGVELVVADDGDDQRNISLIRQHLQKEADRFATGDYRDPARIHGTDMPGLQELQAGHERVRVGYEQVAAGARITYASSDPVLIAALHAWFDAQTGDHSMPGTG